MMNQIDPQLRKNKSSPILPSVFRSNTARLKRREPISTESRNRKKQRGEQTTAHCNTAVMIPDFTQWTTHWQPTLSGATSKMNNFGTLSDLTEVFTIISDDYGRLPQKNTYQQRQENTTTKRGQPDSTHHHHSSVPHSLHFDHGKDGLQHQYTKTSMSSSQRDVLDALLHHLECQTIHQRSVGTMGVSENVINGTNIDNRLRKELTDVFADGNTISKNSDTALLKGNSTGSKHASSKRLIADDSTDSKLLGHSSTPLNPSNRQLFTYNNRQLSKNPNHGLTSSTLVQSLPTALVQSKANVLESVRPSETSSNGHNNLLSRQLLKDHLQPITAGSSSAHQDMQNSISQVLHSLLKSQSHTSTSNSSMKMNLIVNWTVRLANTIRQHFVSFLEPHQIENLSLIEITNKIIDAMDVFGIDSDPIDGISQSSDSLLSILESIASDCSQSSCQPSTALTTLLLTYERGSPIVHLRHDRIVSSNDVILKSSGSWQNPKFAKWLITKPKNEWKCLKKNLLSVPLNPLSNGVIQNTSVPDHATNSFRNPVTTPLSLSPAIVNKSFALNGYEPYGHTIDSELVFILGIVSLVTDLLEELWGRILQIICGVGSSLTTDSLKQVFNVTTLQLFPSMQGDPVSVLKESIKLLACANLPKDIQPFSTLTTTRLQWLLQQWTRNWETKKMNKCSPLIEMKELPSRWKATTIETQKGTDSYENRKKREWEQVRNLENVRSSSKRELLLPDANKELSIHRPICDPQLFNQGNYTAPSNGCCNRDCNNKYPDDHSSNLAYHTYEGVALPHRTGVTFHKASKLWICRWYSNGVQKFRSFSVSRLGYEEAWKQAVALREHKEKSGEAGSRHLGTYHPPVLGSRVRMTRKRKKRERILEERNQDDRNEDQKHEKQTDSVAVDNHNIHEIPNHEVESTSQRAYPHDGYSVSEIIENVELLSSKEDVLKEEFTVIPELTRSGLFKSLLQAQAPQHQKIKGVGFDRSGYWYANYPQSKNPMLRFSVRDYGNKRAQSLAIIARKEAERINAMPSRKDVFDLERQLLHAVENVNEQASEGQNKVEVVQDTVAESNQNLYQLENSCANNENFTVKDDHSGTSVVLLSN